jgi:hypothetical protein
MVFDLGLPIAVLAALSSRGDRSCDHEHPGVNTEARAFAGFSERPDKGASVVVVLDDRLSPVAIAFRPCRMPGLSIVDVRHMSINHD